MKLELGDLGRLEQTQMLSPQVIQNLKILQLSLVDLEQLICSELQKNPVIEESDESSNPDDPYGQESQGVNDEPVDVEGIEQATVGKELFGANSRGHSELTDSAATSDGDDYSTASPRDEYSIGELMPDESYVPLSVTPGREESDAASMELVAAAQTGLREGILPALRAQLSKEDGDLAEILLGFLDEDGFVTSPLDEISSYLGVSTERIRSILYLMQRVPPGGIGCMNLRESLLVQLELAGYDSRSLEWKLVADHWELVKRKQTVKVARLCGVDEEAVRQAVRHISRLELRPARPFAGAVPVYVMPDFAVRWDGDRLVSVCLDDNTPRLRLARRYVEMLRHPVGIPKEQLEFVQKKFNAAVMFLRAIESRRRTVGKLVNLIIEEQREFFAGGPEFLKPATLRQAAAKLGFHPSTASRAIAGKYLETPYGIFPLRYFFRIGTGNTSRTSIKERVQAIIDSEDKTHPYSDDEICSRLKEQGITVSRRTVAKYRGELGLPGCNERRAF